MWLVKILYIVGIIPSQTLKLCHYVVQLLLCKTKCNKEGLLKCFSSLSWLTAFDFNEKTYMYEL